MAAPTVNSVDAFAQGQGESFLPKESVVYALVDFSSTSDHACDFTVQFSIDNGSTWKDATMHHYGRGLGEVPSGLGTYLVIDLQASITANSITPATWTQFKIRFKIKDKVTLEESSYHTHASAITVKGKRPVVNSISVAGFVGSAQQSAVPFTVSCTDYNSSNVGSTITSGDGVHRWKAGNSPADVAANASGPYSSYTTSPTKSHTGKPQGEYTIYYRVYDQYYNASDVATCTFYLQLTAPQNCVARLIGTNGNRYFTGITVKADGSFEVDREVKLEVGASSDNADIPLYFEIDESSTVELTDNVGVELDLNDSNVVQYLNLTTNRSNPSIDDTNQDTSCSVVVKFYDDAGNYTYTTATIRLNTTILQTQHKPIRENSAYYHSKLAYVNSSGVEVVIPQFLIDPNYSIRTWRDIFYPATHGYPKTADGDIDIAYIRGNTNLLNGLPTTQYDPIKLTTLNNLKVPLLDHEGRPTVSRWTQDGTKNYSNMESQDLENPKYWVIDNTGYGDFKLEFGFFDLDSGAYGPPFNNQSPYDGDVLVVYDASADGCVSLEVNERGEEVWNLVDSTKLVELAAYTGSGSNVVNLKTGERMGSTANGEFVTPLFEGIEKVCLILYTDDFGTASGFHVRSGPAHETIFTNYHIDKDNGEIWLHMHETLSAGSDRTTAARGTADKSLSTVKRFYYDYLDNVVTFDTKNGVVQFAVAPSGSPLVEADFAYWHDLGHNSNTFIAAHDDHVDYFENPIYLVRYYGNHLRAPTSGAAATITDSDTDASGMDVRVQLLPNNRGTLGSGNLVYRTFGSTTQFRLTALTDNTLEVSYRNDTDTTTYTRTSSTFTVQPGVPIWVRVVVNGNYLVNQSQVSFYQGTDGETWSQVGTTQTYSTTGGIMDSGDGVQIGHNADPDYPTRIMGMKWYHQEGVYQRFGVDFTDKTPSSSSFSFISYNDLSVSVAANAIQYSPTDASISDADRQNIFGIEDYGRIVQGYAWDKDRGIVEFTTEPVPSGRILVADYFHHTYQRLVSDDYGSLKFKDKILVADQTDLYPDYSWQDVKIVNEGNADIEDMQVKMVPRGYDTNGDGSVNFTGDTVVDRVLDINRPWDIQEGTKEETYDTCAMGIMSSYLWSNPLKRTFGGGWGSNDATNGGIGAKELVSTWRSRAYGTIKSRGRAYGRVAWYVGDVSATSTGRKRWSFQVSGKYYALLVI